MSERKHFQSVLDLRPQFENIIDALVPDIQFSYSAILNNSTIQTYFNMISLEYYGYEFYQLLRLNKLEFKLNERTLNLTILEMVYNIVLQIVSRKWRYSEYIAYDMYILPLRIQKYVNAMNYKFIETEIENNKVVFKLVSQKERIISEKVIEEYQDDRINNIIHQFRSATEHEIELKLALFKNIALFIEVGKPIMYQKFGNKFADDFYSQVTILDKYKSDSLTEKQKKHIAKVVDDLFNISVLLVLLMSDSMRAGVWSKISAEEKRKKELDRTRRTIEEANRRLQAIKEQEASDVKRIGSIKK